jgi:hypothetical protein
MKFSTLHSRTKINFPKDKKDDGSKTPGNRLHFFHLFKQHTRRRRKKIAEKVSIYKSTQQTTALHSHSFSLLTKLLWKFVMNSPFKPCGERHHHLWGFGGEVSILYLAKLAFIHRKI